ncbi:MAG: peptidoglycan-binding domain-containing protein, partial [Gammaproteobacteria bacterium]
APGKCYTEHYVPAQYKTETEQVMVQEAAFQIKVVPAKYEQIEEQVMVKEAATKLVEVPAEYATASEEVMVTAATTEWKKGRGPVEKIDNSTGEILCLVEVPAVYETVERRVLKTAASTKTVEIPAEFKVQRVNKLIEPAREERTEIPAKFEALTKRTKVADDKTFWTLSTEEASEGKATGRTLCLRETPPVYKTVKQRKLKTPATTQVKEIPAQYKTVKMRKVAAPASEKSTEIPAKTQVVTRKVKVTDEVLEWKPVLCETNMSKSLVSDIQRALQKAGHYEGPIDGIIGKQTMTAVDGYQREKGMARGGLTMASLKALGVNP